MTSQRTLKIKIAILRSFVLFITVLGLLTVFAGSALAQNPVPLTNNPLVPDATAPGGAGFTLTVNGTGFVAASTVNWNGSPRATTFVSSSQLIAAILASDIATASTASVTVVNPSPGGGISTPLFFPIAVPEASVSFNQADFSSAGGNINVVAADFAGDGILDLATADYYDGVVRIFLGNGDGTFRAGQTYSACNAHGLAIGDFNGDGIVDLVVADAGCGEVTILLGNGDGTFTEGGSFSTGGDGTDAPYSVAVGDFNGDGKLDLVTADEILNQSSVLIGNGDGTFQPYVAYTTGNDSRKVVTGDFNRDGHLDFAVSGSAGVSVLLGNGDGTFQPQIFYPFASTDNPFMLTADLNGDGILDLAVASTGKSSGTYTAGFVSVMLGRGDGTFNSPVPYPTNGFSIAVAAADFKGNGVLDLVTTNYYTSNISLLPGNGDGTFGSYVNYPGDDGARGIVAADFNGDGRLDLGVGDQFVDFISIYLQPQAVGTTPTTTALASSPNPSTYGQLVTFTAAVTSASGTPTGTVIFYDGSTAIGSATLVSGSASLKTSALATGSHSITAAYQGSSTFAPSASSPLIQTVTPATTSTGLVSSENPVKVNKKVTYTASVTSQYGGAATGTVTFQDNGSTIATVTLSGNQAAYSTSYTKEGVHLITATYSGDANNSGSVSPVLIEEVGKPPFLSDTTLATSGSPSQLGQPVTFTATVTSKFGAIPDGELVTFYDGKTEIGTGTTASGVATFTTSSLTAGTHHIKAKYAGDATFKPSTGKVIQVVEE